MSEDKIPVFVEKSWLVGMGVALLVQIFGGIWWAAVTSTRLEEINKGLSSVQAQLTADIAARAITATASARLEDRIGRLEERFSELSGVVNSRSKAR